MRPFGDRVRAWPPLAGALVPALAALPARQGLRAAREPVLRGSAA